MADLRRCTAAKRRTARTIAGLLAVVCSGPATAATATVVIDGMQFSPASLTINQGDTVIWINRDLVPHTATAARLFDSHAIAPSKSWSWVAHAPGRYEYACTLHPMMKATLVVR